MTVLRSTTFQIEFNGQDGLTGVRQFTKAVTDADTVVTELNKALGENATVTYKTTRSKKELTAEARALTEQMTRNDKIVARLTHHYAMQAQMVGKTAEEIEQLNAVSRLGAGATEAQRQQVMQAVQGYQAMRQQVDGAQGSMRNFRGVMQNFGWQMQDTIVQLQMGTSAFVVLSQQGSQMAAAFGPTGAIVGAFIALAGVVGGTLFTSLLDTTTATDKLTTSMENVAKVFKVVEGNTIELTDEFRELYKVDKQLANLRLQVALLDVEKAMREAKKGIAEGFESVEVGWYRLVGAFIDPRTTTSLESIKKLTTDLTGIKEGSKGFNDAANQIRWFTKQIDELGQGKGNIEEFGRSLRNIQKIAKSGNEDFTNFIRTSLDLVVKFEEGKITAEKLREALANLDQTVVETAGSFRDAKKASDQFISNLAYEAATLGMTQRALREYQINLMDLSETEKAVLRGLNDRIALYGVEEQMAQHFIKLEEDKVKALTKEYNAREAIRRQIENAQVRQFRADNPLQGEMDAFERNLLVLAEQKRQVDALGLAGLAERQRINGLIESEVMRHNSAMEQVNLESLKNSVGVFALANAQVSGIVDMMTNGVQAVREQTAEMNAFQKMMFITTQTIAAANAVINGIDLGMKLAAQFPLAAPAMITFGTALGAAQAGVIAGTTIAGAFDKGGYIPSGQVGITSEYGDELVNGVLVKGPARVTSREETAEMMNRGTNLNVTVENKAPGVSHRVEQIGPNDVKIIAEQVFANNIDQGVSQVINDNNSKSAKSMRRNYNVTRNL